jgi:hypothetical protein
VRIQYKYPGDPITDVDLMFGREFKDKNRGRDMVVSTVKKTSRFPVPDEIVICDECYHEVADLDPCALTDGSLYCEPCFTRIIKPHVLPRREVRAGCSR